MKNVYPTLYALLTSTSLALVTTTALACPPGYMALKSEHMGTGCVAGAPILRPVPPPRARRSVPVISNATEERVRVIDRAQSSYDAQQFVREIERISRNQHLRYR